MLLPGGPAALADVVAGLLLLASSQLPLPAVAPLPLPPAWAGPEAAAATPMLASDSRTCFQVACSQGPGPCQQLFPPVP